MVLLAHFIGALYGLLAVVFGAFGAHALKKSFSEEQLKSFETGVKYQMYHAIVLLILGFNLNLTSSLEKYMVYCFIVGTFLFSFSIYGFAMVALNNSEESYKGGEAAAIAKTKTMVVDQKAQVVFTSLPYGWYGISLYHDENNNGEMDKNAMGIPKEAYGFSNNAKGFFGKPSYKKVMFQLNSVEMQIVINLN